MDRITRLRIKNVRAIESLDLEIAPITVLIGENGSGKSTILECLELLRKATDSSFMQQFYQVHRGMPGLLRKGANSLSLGVVIEDDAGHQPRIAYKFSLTSQGAGAVVESEQLVVGAEEPPFEVLWRTLAVSRMLDSASGNLTDVSSVGPERLLLTNFGPRAPVAVERLLSVLRNQEIHLGFDTLASWATSAVGRTNPLRNSSMILPAERLTLLGQNLANAWSALKNQGEAHWQHTMSLLRLGLGDTVDSVLTAADAGGGNISLLLKRTDLSEPIPSAYLSDGQLSWLAFVAMVRLHGKRSLLAIDEPELHMHPSLLGRVISMLTDLDNGASVVLSTHSDRVLELLDDPASAARVCSLEGSKAIVSKLDPKELPRWLERFGDLGQLRASGYLHRVLVPTEELPDTFGETRYGVLDPEGISV